MPMNKRTYQGGSTAAFVVVAIILLLSLVGAVYYVKQRGEISRKDKAIAAIEDKKTSDEETDNPFEEVEPEKEPNSADNNNPEANTSTELPQGGASDAANAIIAVFSVSTATTLYFSSIRERKSTL